MTPVQPTAHNTTSEVSRRATVRVYIIDPIGPMQERPYLRENTIAPQCSSLGGQR
jgi:hypothetical protein